MKGCREMRKTNKTSLFTVQKYIYKQPETHIHTYTHLIARAQQSYLQIRFIQKFGRVHQIDGVK